MQFKPLRAASCKTLADVAAQIKRWGEILGSIKFDGVRVENIEGGLFSRKLELIPSVILQERFGGDLLHGTDGEMICGKADAPNVFSRTTSAVMSENNPDAVNCRWLVYDDFSLADYNYGYRYQKMVERYADRDDIIVVPQKIITTIEQFTEFEAKVVEKGFEGVMGRNGSLDEHQAYYKYGDATLREGFLWKFKRFVDAEARLVGVEERMKNNNKAVRDNLGRIKRSSAKAGKVGAGTTGTLLGEDVKTGEIIRVGTGLTDEMRQEIWDKREQYMDKFFVYSQQLAGRKDKPRFASFKAFRDSRDILEVA